MWVIVIDDVRAKNGIIGQEDNSFHIGLHYVSCLQHKMALKKAFGVYA